MVIQNNLKIFENISSPQESESIFNVRGGILILQVIGEGSCNLEIRGMVNAESNDFDLVDMVDVADSYNIIHSITKAGTYYVPVIGFGQIKAIITASSGTFTVYGKVGA